MGDHLTEQADKLAKRIKSLGGFSVEAELIMELAEVVAALAQQVGYLQAKALKDKDKAPPRATPLPPGGTPRA